MRFATLAAIASLFAAANAHFQLQFPTPRGPFVEDDEPHFCDGYTDAVSNRSTFPLTGGFISLNSEHPKWTIGVLISTVQNPNSFDNFTTANNQSQFVVPFQQKNGEGLFCLGPIDIGNLGISGVNDGANVTLEFVFDGGDGDLYQCADLTLSSNFTVPSGTAGSCSNVTVTEASSSAGATATSPSGSASGSAASSTQTASSADTLRISGFTAFLFAAGGVLAAL
ncbi:hypothetical protein PUNSTDRAFT_48521 [Punctularia strigosozonata HHB-11173 SS5]|uniref:uncharacterized protein n=1 Tax=Punctularia strigosozonata (strain HHB-11173) TaxID=741275 RepID=UPI0004416D8C|nr:uncharacterized protein PUNSTDRAFT_48521 [Punctularia strigosozonata HHB-11173 SS5]EIN13572.1 hypothetical protein PUNSTDRAFT_48521 [Punctularia strigosozonata HHB-11173 SS5]